VEQPINATANTVGDASFVRILNKDTGAVLVTQQHVAANTANTTFTVAPGQDVLLQKAPSDTLTSNASANCVAAPVKRF
jgi:hypothetical protein